jgi:hypothetical protein
MCHFSPISSERLKNSSSKFSCTCQTYMYEDECEHSLAISILKNHLSESVSMDMPLGLKKCRGRPLKAFKGALNKQPEVNQKYDVKSTGAKEGMNSNRYIDVASSDTGIVFPIIHFLFYYAH